MFREFYSRVNEALKRTSLASITRLLAIILRRFAFRLVNRLLLCSRNDPLWPPADFSLEEEERRRDTVELSLSEKNSRQ